MNKGDSVVWVKRPGAFKWATIVEVKADGKHVAIRPSGLANNSKPYAVRVVPVEQVHP